jgi:hypothetical protein
LTVSTAAKPTVFTSAFCMFMSALEVDPCLSTQRRCHGGR